MDNLLTNGKMKTVKDSTSFEELLDIKYGRTGTPERDEFDSKSGAFMIGELIKDARLNANEPRRGDINRHTLSQ